jgi:hypothetical protein
MADAHNIHATTVGPGVSGPGCAEAVIAMMLAAPPARHQPLLCVSDLGRGGARSIGVSSQLSHLHDCRTATEAGEASVQSLSAWKRRRTPDEVRPSGGDALSCLRLALPPSSCIPPLGRVL